MIKGLGVSPQYINTEVSKKEEFKKESAELSKFEKISRAIENGEYKIDISKTAKALLDEFS